MILHTTELLKHQIPLKNKKRPNQSPKSFSAGRHPRHNGINHIIKRALGSADLNARTEPYTANLSSAEGAIGLVFGKNH